MAGMSGRPDLLARLVKGYADAEAGSSGIAVVAFSGVVVGAARLEFVRRSSWVW
jgi:hypothetical protein